MLEKNISLLPYNTLAVEAKADFLARIHHKEDLKKILSMDAVQGLPLLILGQGSNMLLLEDFHGLVLKMEIMGKEIVKETSEHVWIKVGAGENWHEFVVWAVQNNWAGIENLSLIPGTVGAAPMQNIGAYGVEIKDVFESLEAFKIETLENEVFDASKCDFGYRHSFFKTTGKGKYIIHSVTFKLSKRPVYNTTYGDIRATLDSLEKEASIQSISEAVIKIRQSKLPDPKVLGNAGSFFKNPSIDKSHFEKIQENFPLAPHYLQSNGTIKVPAGWLIEQCGWKGKKIDNVGVHEKQALVLVNFGGAKGSEIQDLAMRIQASVHEKFGIKLEPEVNFIKN